MITSEAWRGKRYAVLGLARSGRATVEGLLASGAEVFAWDEDAGMRSALSPLAFGESPSPQRERVEFPPLSGGGTGARRQGEGLSIANPLDLDLVGFAGVVVSPGVPINRHPVAAHARRFGVPLIGDIELFAQARSGLPAHKVVGITGTNGKSTTTALVHHVLKTAGVPTTMGGNIGLPILAQDHLPPGGVYVVELSSFQIDLTGTLDCDIAVLLNITPDHLDRYDGFSDYVSAKERLFTMQRADKVAVIATDDDPTRMIASRISHRLMRVRLRDTRGQARGPTLQGPHNAQNAAAAVAVCKALGITDVAIEGGLESYPGLPHRMERVREKDGVLYVNDSKATNPTSTAPALAAYPAVHWIVGGRAKGDDIDACAPWFDHVRGAYAIGEAGPIFAELLNGQVASVEIAGTLDKAVARAAAAAQPGETVLLSPACASFDQFTDFEARGNAFRAIVEAL